jgi:hypothetical protein
MMHKEKLKTYAFLERKVGILLFCEICTRIISVCVFEGEVVPLDD